MKVIIILFSILGVIAVIYFGVAMYIAYALTIPGESPISYDRSKIGRGTDVAFKSRDNLQLAGWYFPGTNGKALLFVHGAGNQNRVNELYGTAEIAKYFLEKGYTVLLFDLRGTGESAKTRMSFGQYESIDVASAFDYLKAQDYDSKKIGIIGNSLGAISTMMAADTVKEAGALVLDSPAMRVKPSVSYLMKTERSVPEFIHEPSFFFAKLLYKIDVNAVAPIEKAPLLSNTPVLFLHAQNDILIPPFNTEELQKAVPGSTRVVFPDSTHVETYKDHPQLYLETVESFLEENLE